MREDNLDSNFLLGCLWHPHCGACKYQGIRQYVSLPLVIDGTEKAL
jgi:hypothetical protein